MRDPARIPKVLELLRTAWERFPDQRLTQLVLNACRDVTGPCWPDVWNVEDDASGGGVSQWDRPSAACAGGNEPSSGASSRSRRRRWTSW